MLCSQKRKSLETRIPFIYIKKYQVFSSGDRLYGRGTTDCLGHVALLVLLFTELAKNKPELENGVACVLIADEECGSGSSIGIGKLQNEGKLDFLKNGVSYWLDASGMFPTIACCSGLSWQLTVTGKKSHSGFPQNGINAILLANYVIDKILTKFHAKFSEHPLENKYKFLCSSTMKPTQYACSSGSVNQIPDLVTICGDIRLTPFYKIEDAQNYVNDCVNNIIQDLGNIKLQHKEFKNIINGHPATIKIEWPMECYKGIACDMNSTSFKIMSEALTDVIGKMDYESVGGSLPLIASLQDLGIDLQMIGFGVTNVYHGDDEYCNLSDMDKGFQIIWKLINLYNKF